jgi:hypothetical protein
MSELVPIWNHNDLTGATLPPFFPIPNNPNARSLKINNQSQYWLFLSKTQTNTIVDRIMPFSNLIIPIENDLSISIDTADGTAPKSSLTPDRQFVDCSFINGAISYQENSTQFSGTSTVEVSQAQIDMTATNVTINNGGTYTLSDASGSIVSASIAQTVLNANNARKYLLFQNISDTDMFISLVGTAGISAPGSIWIQANGGSVEYAIGAIPANALSVICQYAGKAFTCIYS